MTQGEGQARTPMTGLLFTEKPNLEGSPATRAHTHTNTHTSVAPSTSGTSCSVTGCKRPHLSLRTTPSIQAPKKSTLETSEQEVKRKGARGASGSAAAACTAASS